MSQYYQPLEAEIVLYTLWEKLDQIQPTKKHITKIVDTTLSANRSGAIARYTVRVVAPEALDAVGKTEEAQKLRDLPPDVNLSRARAAAFDVVYGYGNAGAGNVARAVYAAADAARAACDRYAFSAVIFATDAALYASKATSKRHLSWAPGSVKYHINQMIKMCSEIK